MAYSSATRQRGSPNKPKRSRAPGIGSDPPTAHRRARLTVVMRAQQEDRRAGMLRGKLKTAARGQIHVARARSDDRAGADAQRLFHRPRRIALAAATHHQKIARIEAEGFEPSRVGNAECSGNERPHHDALAFDARHERKQKSPRARNGAEVSGGDLMQRPKRQPAAQAGVDPGDASAHAGGRPDNLPPQSLEERAAIFDSHPIRHGMFLFCSISAPRPLASQRGVGQAQITT